MLRTCVIWHAAVAAPLKTIDACARLVDHQVGCRCRALLRSDQTASHAPFPPCPPSVAVIPQVRHGHVRGLSTTYSMCPFCQHASLLPLSCHSPDLGHPAGQPGRRKLLQAPVPLPTLLCHACTPAASLLQASLTHARRHTDDCPSLCLPNPAAQRTPQHPAPASLHRSLFSSGTVVSQMCDTVCR